MTGTLGRTSRLSTLASRHSPRNGRRVRGNPNSPTSTPPSVGAYDHLENVGLRVLVQRRDALRNHGATSHTHRSPRNVVQRRDGGDLVSCRFHFPHSFRRRDRKSTRLNSSH